MAPETLEAVQKLEHEKLQEADSVARVSVPDMDFTVPDPPWKIDITPEQADEAIQSLMLPIAKLNVHHWSGTTKIEADLPWVPFPRSLGQAPVEEHINETSTLENLLGIAEAQEMMNIDDLIWKPEGLRVLDEQKSDDDDIGPAAPQSGNDWDYLLRKRKLEIEDASLGSSKTMKTQREDSGLGMHRALQPSANLPAVAENIIPSSNPLDQFMGMRGRAFKQTRKEECIAKDAQPHTMQADLSARKENKPRKQPNLPTPWSGHPIDPRTIIVSSVLMAQQCLIRHLIKLCPTVELIERDWKIADMSKSDRCRPAETDDGDILINPSCSVICTTMQKIKQRPLPGDKTEPALWRRIARAARRTERLVMIVNIPSDSAGDGVDERDCQALNELVIFAAGKKDEIAVYLVAGGDAEMAKWIAGLLSANPLPPNVGNLLPDETLVSRFPHERTFCRWLTLAVGDLPPQNRHERFCSASHTLRSQSPRSAR